MKKPVIGITTAGVLNERAGKGARFMTAFVANVKAVEKAGGLPLLIPCDLEPENLREAYEYVDAVLLPGGGDVDPSTYHAERHPKTGTTDLQRDNAEMTIARWAADEDRPLFAICRGQQIVNVALGGTLIQDIPLQFESDLSHNFPESMERDYLSHDVAVEPGSQLEQITGLKTLKVNSMHHQAIETLADPLKITGRATDGMIEATELPGLYFYHTVQWHPEDLTHIEAMQKLYNALVEAARNRMTP